MDNNGLEQAHQLIPGEFGNGTEISTYLDPDQQQMVRQKIELVSHFERFGHPEAMTGGLTSGQREGITCQPNGPAGLLVSLHRVDQHHVLNTLEMTEQQAARPVELYQFTVAQARLL